MNEGLYMSKNGDYLMELRQVFFHPWSLFKYTINISDENGLSRFKYQSDNHYNIIKEMFERDFYYIGRV